ncbi:MAG TPA: glycosyltransferase family 4 protein [Gemmatimonadales bacterium]|nr:glycosyltransferase family 4 protein [Gemmatimonadales bacterium]
MRILHVVTAFPRGPDDPITPWLVELLQRLRAAGHDVEVITSAYKGSPDETFAGIPVHRFRYFFRRWENLTHEETAPDRMRRSLLYRVMPLCFVLGGMRAIRRLTNRRQYDVIHVHWPLPLALLGWAAQRRGRPPIVTTFYGAELRLGFRRFLAWAARRAARVIAISSYTAAALREIANVPIAVIPYAASLPPARPKTDADREHVPTVLFVGRLVERKGVTHLVEAVAQLADRRARLVIVGDGPERPRLEARARELGIAHRVEFRGRISDADLRTAYQRAGVFVLPAVLDSRGDTEGLGVVLLEAMNYGVPVIASNIGGIVDIVVDQETGLLVPPGDAAALASALDSVLRDPARSRRLGEAGRRRLAEQFSWDAILAKMESVYRSVR